MFKFCGLMKIQGPSTLIMRFQKRLSLVVQQIGETIVHFNALNKRLPSTSK